MGRHYCSICAGADRREHPMSLYIDWILGLILAAAISGLVAQILWPPKDTKH